MEMGKNSKDLLEIYAVQGSQDEDVAYDDEIRAEADLCHECCSCCRTCCIAN